MTDSIRSAIAYLTYNGIYNFTNGIGTQSQLLLSGLEHLKDELYTEFGRLDVHVACPMPDQQTWGFDKAFLRRQHERIKALGGSLHFVSYKKQPAQELWDLRSWLSLSKMVTPWLQGLYTQYDRCLTICVDQPWLLTPTFLAHGHRARPQQPILLVLYNTAFIRSPSAPNTDEIAWEQQGLTQSEQWQHVSIADVCPSFTDHLQANFQFPQLALAPFTSSIMSIDADFRPLPAFEVQNILERYQVPLNIPIVLAFGRAAPIKGFDLLIAALQALRQQCHLVLISVPYRDDHAEQLHYDNLLALHQVPATHIKQFNRELPKALCQWPGTKMVVAPSRQETFSNIPLEVALWAQRQGPVLVASDVGGFVDLIEDYKTGFLFKSASRQSLQQTLQRVFRLSPEILASIRHRLYQRVIRQHDFQHTLPTTLRWFWGS